MNLSIKGRLALAMTVLSVLLLAIGVSGLVGIAKVFDANRQMFQERMPKIVAADNTLLWIARQRTSLDQAAVTQDPAWEQQQYKNETQVREQALQSWARYEALPQTPEGARLTAEVSSGIAKTEQAIDDFRNAIQKHDPAAISAAARVVGVVYTAMQKNETALTDYESEQALASHTAAESTYATFRWLSLGSIGFGLLVAAASWWSLRRAISVPINQALAHFDDIAQGNLTRRVLPGANDEMGRLLAGLATMQGNLVRTVSSVRFGSEEIAAATRQISAGNLDLSSRTEQQAASLEETASSMKEMAGTVRQNAQSAQQATALAVDASDIAGRGHQVVSDVVDNMNSIKDSSNQIADIVGIIESIAFQTNILALNAAVEAARAGEQGRGFAVVASEVRALAHRSSGAAKEIKTLIAKSMERVQAGAQLAQQAGSTMSEVIAAVRRVTAITAEISTASTAQSSGIDEVSNAVIQMDDATQRNAALVEEASAAAQSLEQQALTLRDAVAVFRINETAPA